MDKNLFLKCVAKEYASIVTFDYDKAFTSEGIEYTSPSMEIFRIEKSGDDTYRATRCNDHGRIWIWDQWKLGKRNMPYLYIAKACIVWDNRGDFIWEDPPSPKNDILKGEP